MSFVSTAFAQTEAPAAATQATTEAAPAHGGEHHTFPPFDPSTFGPQLFWLVIAFGLLYLVMRNLAIPRIGSILEERSGRIAGDLAEAGRMKSEAEAAGAAYEQALAEARQNAHQIAQKARDEAKAAIDADRARTEASLNGKLAAAEAEIGKVKASALASVDQIARDAVETMVEVLVGAKVEKAEVAQAVEAAMAEASAR